MIGYLACAGMENPRELFQKRRRPAINQLCNCLPLLFKLLVTQRKLQKSLGSVGARSLSILQYCVTMLLIELVLFLSFLSIQTSTTWIYSYTFIGLWLLWQFRYVRTFTCMFWHGNGLVTGDWLMSMLSVFSPKQSSAFESSICPQVLNSNPVCW